VSRLLVQLHPYIQRSLVRKYDVVIVMEGSGENTQGWIRVEPERNRFVVMVRGSEVRYCIRLQEWILTQVKEVCGTHYSSVLETTEEWIRSPHYSGSEIALTEVASDVARGENERVLVCPETRLPIRAEMLLMRAGMTIPNPTSNSNNVLSWWNFGSTTTGSGSGMKMERPILHLLTKPSSSSTSSSSTSLSDGGVYSKFEELLVYLGGDVGKVSRVYAIDHPSQRASFENYLPMITEKHADSEKLFKKDGWRQASDAAVRKRYLLHLAEKITKFSDFNDGDKAFVLPVVQGTSENAAFRIIKNGFGTVGSVDDGYYGRGMYFTSRLQYAARYAQITPHGKVFLIALTVPGNPYPVTEPPFVGEAKAA